VHLLGELSHSERATCPRPNVKIRWPRAAKRGQRFDTVTPGDATPSAVRVRDFRIPAAARKQARDRHFASLMTSLARVRIDAFCNAGVAKK